MEGWESNGGGRVTSATKGSGGHCGDRQSRLGLLPNDSVQSGLWQGRIPFTLGRG